MTGLQLQRMDVERVDPKPGDPDLTVKLKIEPPIVDPKWSHRQPWTLATLEDTVLELRAAGAWDGSKVELSYGKIECEILTGRGEDVMPWGYRPIFGPAQPAAEEPVVSWLSTVASYAGHRMIHTLLLLTILALVVTR